MSLLPLVTFANPNTELYAAAGGSVSSFNTLTVSSLTAYPNSATNQSYVVVGGTPNTNVTINNVSSAISYMDLSLSDANGVNKDRVRTNLVHDVGMTSVYSQNNGANFKGSIAILSSINSGTGGVVLTAQGGASLSVANGTVTTSSFTVSTINGRPPAGAPSTIGFVTANFPGGAGTVPISGTPFAMTNSFAVNPTHRYRVSFEAGYTNVDATSPTYTTAYISGTSPTQYITTIVNCNAIPALNDARASASAVFVPNSSPCQIITANSSGLATTGMTVNAIAGVVLEDLGAV